jgi:hypothetical protein
MTVVSLKRSRTPQPSRTPEIVMTPALAIAASSSEHDVTVVPVPLPPPVVPTPYPTRSSTPAELQALLVSVVAGPVDVVTTAVVVVFKVVEALVVLVTAAVPG